MALQRSVSNSSNSLSETSFTSSSSSTSNSLNFAPLCKDKGCEQPLIRCSYPKCDTYVCKHSPLGMDSFFYRFNHKQRVVCIDCLPFITINLEKGTIKKRIFSDCTTPSSSSDEDQDQDQDHLSHTSTTSTATSKQSWTTKNGFRPLSTALTILMSAIYDAEKEKTA